MAKKANSIPCQTYEMELIPRSRYLLQRQIQNFAKHLRWSLSQKKSKIETSSFFGQKPLSWYLTNLLLK